MSNFLDPFEINRQFVLHLRKNITDPLSRLSTKTENFTGSLGQATFEIQEDLEGGNHTLKHIEYVKVDDVEKTFPDEYNYYVQTDDAGKVIFTTAPDAGSDIEIKYWLGPQSWIYMDFPRLNLRLSDFPRISVETIAGTSELAGLGGEQFTTSVGVAVTCFGKSIIECKSIGNEVREFILSNAKRLIYQSGCGNFNYIKLTGFSKIMMDPNRIDKVFQQTWDYMVINIDEEV